MATPARRRTTDLRVMYGVTLLLGIILAGSCGRWRSFTLHPGERRVLIQFEVPDSAEALLEMELRADVDWGSPGRESAVLRVTLDGRRNHDVLLVHSPTHSQTMLGPVSAGKHAVELELDRWLTADSVHLVLIRSARVRLISARDRLYRVVAHAPFLYGRPGNERTDAPLVAWHEVTKTDSSARILYSIIWSNEDGGTDTDDLLSRWGRTTDIEWIYEVELDRDGRVVKEVFHGPEHKTLPFRGRKRGAHPYLRTCTLNNNVCDSDSSDLLFALAPLLTRAVGEPREHLMDSQPWTYAVMVGELRREGKLEPTPDPATPEPGDLRDFLFVDFLTEGNWNEVDLVFAAQDTDGRWYACNHGIDSVQCVNAPGPRRTSIEMPPGWDIDRLRRLRVEARADHPFAVRIRRIHRIFQLGENWYPELAPWHWQGDETLTPECPVVEWDIGPQVSRRVASFLPAG